MMKNKLGILLAVGVLAISVTSIASVVSFAFYERVVVVEDSSGSVVPIAVDDPRDTHLYFYPGPKNGGQSWGGQGLLNGKENTYMACCFFKNDDTAWEWQLIKSCNQSKVEIAASDSDADRIIAYTVRHDNGSNEVCTMFRFDLDLTYYDRFIFLRIAATKNLFSYMGISVASNSEAEAYTAAPDFFLCTSRDENQQNIIPLDWRNYDRADDYRRYDATHRLTKPKGKNCYEIKKSNSSGSFGFLASGDWWDLRVEE